MWDDDIDPSDIMEEDAYAPGGEAYDPTEAGASGKKSRADRKKEKKQKKRDKGKGKADQEDDESKSALAPEELEAIADPEERRRRIEQYMEEYHKLNHEDIVSVMILSRASSVLTMMFTSGRRFAYALPLYHQRSE